MRSAPDLKMLQALVRRWPIRALESGGEITLTCPVTNNHVTHIAADAIAGGDWLWCGAEDECDPEVVLDRLNLIVRSLPDKCPEAGRTFHRAQSCPQCQMYEQALFRLTRTSAGELAAAPEPSSWGRLDLRNVPAPTPPSVGRITEGAYLFTRGRRHNVYGESETGKSRLCYCSAVREALSDHAVVLLNGEMNDEDVLDWVLSSSEKLLTYEEETKVLDGIYVYPSSGLLTEGQRRTILTDIAESGRELTLAVVDSATSLISEAGLNPNKSEDIERLWRDLGLWFTRLPSQPAFVMIDHVSKGADGKTPTASIRKHNVVDLSMLVENVQRFMPATQYGPAKSGYSTVTLQKGRRGGTGLEIARIIGHDERVWVDSPKRGVPWAKSRDYEPSEGEVALLRAVATLADWSDTTAILEAAGGNRSTMSSLLTDLRDYEAMSTEKSFLIVKRDGRSLLHHLTERGRSYVE